MNYAVLAVPPVTCFWFWVILRSERRRNHQRRLDLDGEVLPGPGGLRDVILLYGIAIGAATAGTWSMFWSGDITDLTETAAPVMYLILLSLSSLFVRAVPHSGLAICFFGAWLAILWCAMLRLSSVLD